MKPASRWTLEDGTRGIGFTGVSWLLRPDGNVHVEWFRVFGVKTLIDIEPSDSTSPSEPPSMREASSLTITSPPPTIEEFEKAWAQAPH